MLYTHGDTATGDRSFQKPHLVLSFLRLQECGHKEERTNSYFYPANHDFLTSGASQLTYLFFSYSMDHLVFYARLLWNCPDPPSLHKEASWPPGGLHFFPSSQRALKSSPRGKQDKAVSSGTPQVGAFWTHPSHSRWLDALFCLQHSGQSWTTIRTLRWTETSLWP